MNDSDRREKTLGDQIPVDELRRLYVSGNLRQRYSIARARRQNPDHAPNQLVSALAALEGFARAVAVSTLVAQGQELESAYTRLRWKNPLELLEGWILPFWAVDPTDVFERKHWNRLAEAIDFRNLLVHEATYLHGHTCSLLIESVDHLFDAIALRVGVAPKE